MQKQFAKRGYQSRFGRRSYLSFPEGVFDAINVGNMLHHHTYKFLLNPNGAIIFEEPSVESKGEALEKKSALKSEFETYLEIRREKLLNGLQACLDDLIPMLWNNLPLTS